MNDRGSIFLETVIATAILALMLGGAFEILQDSARRARRVLGQREAMMIAQSHLAEYPLARPAPLSAREGEEGGYRWRAEIAPGALHLPLGPVGVTVTVVSLSDPSIRVRLESLRPGTPG